MTSTTIRPVPSPEQLEYVERLIVDAYDEIEQIGWAVKALRDATESVSRPSDRPTLTEAEIGRFFLFAEEAQHTAQMIGEKAREIIEALPFLHYGDEAGGLADRDAHRAYRRRIASEYQRRAEELERDA